VIPRVKVCGVTSYEDAIMCLDSGADALGFNFYRPSPRFIDPAAARAIIPRLPPLITTVGVFVNVEEPDDVAGAAQEAGIHVIQLHGDEAPDYCRKLSAWPLIKAVRMAEGTVQPDLQAYPVQAILLDSKDDFLFGGTGKAFDWAVIQNLACARPLILAGGLNPSNIARAIRAVKPYAVDVCSGVESSPGKKDAAKLRAFMNEVRNVANEARHGTR
jgi:phosphoribosylanthranilate isomerase